MWWAGDARTLRPDTRVAGAVEYLSSYVYRLVFAENFSQAISSEVASDLAMTHESNGVVPSAFDRPVPDIRQLNQRRRGQNSSSA